MEGATFHLGAGLSEGKGSPRGTRPGVRGGRRGTVFSSVQGNREKKSQDSSELHTEILENHKDEKEVCFLLSSEQRLKKKRKKKKSPAS